MTGDAMTGDAMTGDAMTGDAMTGDAMTGDVLAGLMRILAEVTGDPHFTAAPETPLLRDGVGLDSVSGALLLVKVHAAFGVEVADEDLNLDSLATIGTLAAFVEDRIARC